MRNDTPGGGQGLGTALAQRFLSWAHENGAEHIRVTAYAANEGAVHFYQRLGFVPRQLTLERSL